MEPVISHLFPLDEVVVDWIFVEHFTSCVAFVHGQQKIHNAASILVEFLKSNQ
jgi:hypothetical protein